MAHARCYQSGTMFEYLMPALLMRNYDGRCYSAVVWRPWMDKSNTAKTSVP
jgi:hypothetical protein